MSQAPVPSDPMQPAEVPPTTPDDRNMAMLCHLGGVLLGFLVPLIIWLLKKDQSRYVDDQGREALNFQMTMLIGHLIGLATLCFTFGIVNLILYILGLVFGIMGTMAASRGEVYRYPMNIRMLT